ncbi:YjcZ family sporulation protein [Paenibacillus sp. BJ-4]|nr:YjcZ family sporulation protein [Paenibacillus sp. BJ-4]
MSGCAGPAVCNVWTSTAAILVLYILLVIILKSCWV